MRPSWLNGTPPAMTLSQPIATVRINEPAPSERNILYEDLLSALVRHAFEGDDAQSIKVTDVGNGWLAVQYKKASNDDYGWTLWVQVFRRPHRERVEEFVFIARVPMVQDVEHGSQPTIDMEHFSSDWVWASATFLTSLKKAATAADAGEPRIKVLRG